VRAVEASARGVPSGRRDVPGQACWHGIKGRVLTMESRHVCQRLHASENQQPFVITLAPLGHRACQDQTKDQEDIYAEEDVVSHDA
jgi:hypothetical protein